MPPIPIVPDPRPGRPNPSAGHSPTNGTSVLTEALRLFDRGLWVVPMVGKKPIVAEWGERQLSKAELRAKLASPDRGIAIVLNQSNLVDVECDSDEAETALLKLFNGEIPSTPTWRSKRGMHRLFVRPEGLPESAVKKLDGIEFRIGNGRGALSVVPPSATDGVTRHWLPGLSLFEVEPAELPPSIVERLRAPDPTPGEQTEDEPIPEGKRNDTLFQKACALRDLKFPAETILATLLDLNRRICKPPLPEAEVREIAKSVAKGESRAKSFVGRLLEEIDLWHDDSDEPYATLPQEDHKEHWRIGSRSRSFRRWLSKRFYEVTGGGVLTSSDLSDMAALLEGKATFGGPLYPVFRRTAQHEGKFYLDLCDEKWRAVEIDAEGWRVVDEPPVKFRRAKAMMPLPDPVKTRVPLRQLLRPFLNIRETQWPLVGAWLAAAIRPIGPYPLLKLLGEQGAAKTTTARVFRAVIDPNAAPVRAEPRDARDLMIAASNGWVLCLDNLSFVPPWLSDALCRIATGGGFATRTLYTDDDETIFDARRPVILTSIEDVGSRSDLLERSLLIDLPTIREGERKAEKAFWSAFDRARPKILGALLDVVVGAIRRLPEIEREPNPDLSRMADFEQWGRAAEQPLNLAPGTFAEAYAANRESATQVALESSPVVSALLKLLAKTPSVEMTATELLEKLGYMDYELKKSPGWPKTPRVLSQILRRVAPNLRQIGIVATQDTRGGGTSKEKVWRIEKTETPEPDSKSPQTCAPSEPSAPTLPKSSAFEEWRRKQRVARTQGSQKSAPCNPAAEGGA